MLERVRQVLNVQVTVGQLIVVGLIVGTPYLLVETVWSMTHTEAFASAPWGRSGGVVFGFDRVVASTAVLRRMHDMSVRTESWIT
ncbi:hypothetical protein MSIMFB_00631 [Mycobacterium simulans]|uniref:Uncharacterized protein n=1 Tax=Mycobacterium simulans TaxID=627089 RepID=A0A7Z7IGR5_9MYCO|nr:hypothetical protein MSIMFB_00631 [Mycobacterium simulans]